MPFPNPTQAIKPGEPISAHWLNANRFPGTGDSPDSITIGGITYQRRGGLLSGTLRRATLAANVANGATGTFATYTGVQGSETETGEVEAYVDKGICLISNTEKYILQKISGTWYVQNPILSFVGVADSTFAQGVGGTVSVWTSLGGSFVDSTMNVTVSNTAADITSGETVLVQWVDGQGGWEAAPICS